MTVLYLDTTSSFLYAGIVTDNKLICEIKKDLGKELSVYALSEIAKLIEDARIKPNDIEKIIVVNGPGSFTGIRIGITIAKTYAWALNIPIITLSSLEAMAISCKNKSYKIPLIDARRDCSYYGIYDEENNIVKENSYSSNIIIKEEIDKLNTDKYTIISNDYDKTEKIENYEPNILDIVLLIQGKESINCHSVNPMYLKLTEAEEKKQ